MTAIGGITINQDGQHFWWTSGLAVDCDGAPEAYHPNGSPPGLDYLGDAGKPGNWCGLVTDNNEPDGNPVLQGAGAPAPGFYISQTALRDHNYDRCDPRCYVDATKVPYLSVPPELRSLGIKMGDVGICYYKGKSCPCVVAEAGPHNKIGEGSMALAAALGLNNSPKHGGTTSGVEMHVWAGSGKGWPRTQDDIAEQVASLSVCVTPPSQ